MKAIENNHMMKNIYIAISSAALCAAVLTGCQKENWFNGRSGDGMLSFEASVSPQKGMPVGTKSGVLSGGGIELPFSCEIEDGIGGLNGGTQMTKGELLNTTGSTGKLSDYIDNFTVNAWNGDGTAFISGTQVNWNDSKGKWATGTPSAWTGAAEKTFYAWTNLPASGATVTNSDASTFALTYTVPATAEAQTDILMGWYNGNGDVDGDGLVDGVASLAFSHPLTSVAFVKGEMEGVSEIRSITLTGVYGSGDCAATYVKGATNVVPTYSWSNFGESAKVTLGSGDSALAVDSETDMIGEPFILIPQDLTAASVKLEVIVLTEAGNLARISGTLSTGAWVSGKITFYTIGYAAKPALPAGALPGVFTASNDGGTTKTPIHFSQGNLYYDGSKFNFEANQYGFKDSWDEAHVSHFYWSQSVNSSIAEEYDWIGNDSDVFFTNETVTTAKAGFTVNVGDKEKSGWRTLSTNEWQYLFKTRTVNGGQGAGKSYSLNITYGGKMGLVLYPDDYDKDPVTGTVTDLPDGVVFLPAAGLREGSDVSNVGVSGHYWSSSAIGSDFAYGVDFFSGFVSPGFNDGRYSCYSVRLITECQ